MPPRPSLLLLTTISLPAFTLLYFRSFPQSQIRSHSISQIRSIPASLSSSKSVRKIVNPRHHAAMEDTRSVLLSKSDVRGMSDEEILARFVRGFFGGWAFWPEKCLLGVLTGLGLRFGIFGAGFTVIPEDGRLIPVFSSELTRNDLPEKHTQLFGGNFLVLDAVLLPRMAKTETKEETPEDEASVRGSYIDIGFGDDRKTFSGLHRFEVLRNGEDDLEDAGGARIVYSCLACNPTVKDASYFKVIHGFHMVYALMLFKDGIREVLRA